jgi:hypothetical protein
MAELARDTTFIRQAKANPLDTISVEVGDSKQPEFYPQVKVMRWDNEVNFSARLVDDAKTTAAIAERTEYVEWVQPDKEAHFYELPASESLPDGGYEFEVFLKERPATNVVRFTIRTKGLDFFYQPALTEDEIKQGAVRPDNVVGSYAAYYRECPANIAGGKEYKAGKAFHIYRPRIEDAKGAWVWGALNIDPVAETLTVTIPQKFLDAAAYPVRHAAGLTFGYTTAGGSSMTLNYNAMRLTFATGASGQVLKLTAHLKNNTGSPAGVRGAIYQKSNYLRNGYGPEASLSASESAFTWRDLTINSGGAISAVDYGLAPWASAQISASGDYVQSAGREQSGVAYSSVNPPPETLSSTSNSNTYISIYATYAAGAEPEAHEGGAAATVNVVASSGGAKNASGGSGTSALIAASGAGTKYAASGAESTVIVSASGAGEVVQTIPIPTLTAQQIGSAIHLIWEVD